MHRIEVYEDQLHDLRLSPEYEVAKREGEPDKFNGLPVYVKHDDRPNVTFRPPVVCEGNH